jgi:hypothetical protein
MRISDWTVIIPGFCLTQMSYRLTKGKGVPFSLTYHLEDGGRAIGIRNLTEVQTWIIKNLVER